MQTSLPLQQGDACQEILELLKGFPYVYIGANRKEVKDVLILRKEGVRYAIMLPQLHQASNDDNIYIYLRPIVLSTGKLILGKPISGLCLMDVPRQGFERAIQQYNQISKAIGEFKLFGEIDSLVAIDTQLNTF